MELDEEYPMQRRNSTVKLRKILNMVPGLDEEEIATLATAINHMADKAWDLNNIFERILNEPHSLKEISELLIAFELSTESFRGFSDDIDGKMYEIGERVQELPANGMKGRKQKVRTKAK